jgi:hypothetical protein
MCIYLFYLFMAWHGMAWHGMVWYGMVLCMVCNVSVCRAGGRELRRLEEWLDSPPTQWVEQATAVDGPFYQAVLAILLLPPQDWLKRRVQVLHKCFFKVFFHQKGTVPRDF